MIWLIWLMTANGWIMIVNYGKSTILDNGFDNGLIINPRIIHHYCGFVMDLIMEIILLRFNPYMARDVEWMFDGWFMDVSSSCGSWNSTWIMDVYG